MRRPVQMAMLDGIERGVGPIPGSVQTGVNADLIAAIAPIYLTGSVLDVTYGRGMWWRRFTPDPFTFHDLALDGVDFRQLPHPDRSFDAVCFDPPYVPRHGPAAATTARDLEYRDRYGLVESRSHRELRQLIADGLAETARVTDRWLLVKCNDFVNGRKFHMGHVLTITEGERLGLTVHDLIVHHAGAGPGGSRIVDVLRTRRTHSYLVVFRRRRARRR